MQNLKLVIGIILSLFGGYITIMNWLCVYYSCKENKFHSAVPLLGGVSLTVGSALILNVLCKRLWLLSFLGLVIDYGSLPAFVSSLGYYLFVYKKKNK